MDSIEIWSIVKLRLGLKYNNLQPLIESYIYEIRYRILHYCNLDKIPDGLKYTWVSMVVDAVRVDLPSIAEINDTVGGGENIKVGDTSISSASTSVSNVSKSVIDNVIFNYKVDLDRYRRMGW